MNIIINGINGRMGRMVLETAAEDSDVNVLCGFDAVESPLGAPTFRGKEVPVYADYSYGEGQSVGTMQAAQVEGADAIIDFSHFSAIPTLLDFAVAAGIPTVVATTALGEAERDKLREAAKSIAVFNSSNMSLGVNIVKKMAQLAAPVLEKDFNTEIIEAHHNMKKDSPSGTAIMLADAINESCATKKDYVFGRHGKSDEVKITDLGIHAVRGGTLPGKHTILFAGPDEIIEITHTAYSRRIFALGALKAASYIAGRSPGFYTMEDMI